ncbi:hypothetical protein [Methylorubrum aminovorans]
MGDIGLKIAVAHDGVSAFQGGERGVLEIARGGARDIVREFDGPEAPTGVLFKEQTVDSLKQVVTTFEARRGEITPEACAASAVRFLVDRFKRELRDAFEETCTLVRA